MSNPDVTGLLRRLDGPQPERERALEELIPIVYDDLKALARHHRYGWQGRRSLGTTSLVHEAYAKLSVQDHASFSSRRQFFALASKVMRTLLIDHARHHKRAKRGHGRAPEQLNEANLVSVRRASELLALDDALLDLEAQEPELAQIVELRCFGGLTVEEIAEVLDIGSATVKRRWAFVRTWLYRYLAAADDPVGPTTGAP